MTSAPSFSSFPDLPTHHKQKTRENKVTEPIAGPSRPPAPTFGSFGDLEPKKAKRRSRSPPLSHSHQDRDERKTKRREYDDTSASKSERRHRDGNDRDEEGTERRRERSRDREKARSTRHREASEDRRRHREEERKYRERDKSAERRYKEDRRRRERKAAEQLVRGDFRSSASFTEGSKEKEEERWKKMDEGVAWYEAGNGVKKESRYGEEETFDPSSAKAFFSDIVGDRDILRYGNQASTAAPRYHRDGRNRILGLPEILRVVYSRERTQKGVELAPMGKPYIPRYSARPLESSAGRHLRRILLQPQVGTGTNAFDPRMDVIAFDTCSRRQEDDTPAYKSITHQPTEEEREEEELSALQAVVGNYSTLEQEVRKKTAELERYLRHHPRDVERWLEYSRLHLRLSPERRSSSKEQENRNTTRAQAEVTLSILSRALNADEQNEYSAGLHLAYLEAAEEVWPAEKVTARWKNLLREVGESGQKQKEEEGMDLWLGYIEWREGQGFGKDDRRDQGEASGGVDEVVDVYIECLDKLKTGTVFGSDLQAKEENLVYLFLRACLFLKQAGYEERALAAFQALMEITFFKPDHLRYTPDPFTQGAWFTGVLSEFEDFWDEELPRLGEDGAQGWRNASATPAPPSSTIQPITHTTEDPFERWLEAERHAEKTYARPGRATDLDEMTEDDPFHVVLFADIQPLLFPIFTPEVRQQLIYVFLTFLGIPLTPPNVSTAAAATTDPHLRWTLSQNERLRKSFWPEKEGGKRLAWQTVGGEPMEPERKGLKSPFGCPVKCWVQGRDTMFAQSGGWFRDIGAMDLEGVDVPLVRNVFASLRPLVPDPAFTLASFAFEAAVSPKGAIKLARNILSSDRDNLLLWDGYARLERQRGNLTIARSVYVTALQAARAAGSPQDGGAKTEDEVDLWAGWAEMEFFDLGSGEGEGGEERCLQVLVMAAGVGEERIGDHADPKHLATPPSSISLLKARQYYSTPPADPSQLLLAALFTCLHGNIESARSLILDHVERLPPSCAEAEEALQLLTKLLWHHTSRHASPASLSRDVLGSSLAIFPSNTSFLSLYLYGELGGRVYGRVQRLISTITSPSAIGPTGPKGRGGRNEGTVSHLWAVWAEGVLAHRTFWDQGGGGAERVRQALDRGINGSGRHSAALWMLYIDFEVLMRRWEVAKKLCYRAVSACGGCKALYLLPFTQPLRAQFSHKEMRDWAELMLERGIRIRVPFDQFWSHEDDHEEDEDGNGEGAVVLPFDEEVGEDELAFLSERQALKPY